MTHGALLAAAVLAFAIPQKGHDGGAGEIAIELKQLDTVGAALYVAAHPDDENTALLAYLARERCVRAGYLSVTRGGGGQNLIGNEKGEYLDVLRTQELLAARRVDGAEQYFTRAVDFGYSKNPEETLRIWGKEAILGDVVWAIRKFQPDVIITRFPTTGEGGHGHHTASAMLAEEAFTLAADASQYPEQLKFVKPWQAKRVVWNSFRPNREPVTDVKGLVKVDLGTFNPILGKSYTEIAGESRSQHKSQGFGSAERRGSRIDYFEVMKGEPAKEDLFEGVDLTWGRIPGGEKVGALLAEARKAFTLDDPSKSVPALVTAQVVMKGLAASPIVEFKRHQLAEVVRKAAGIVLDTAASRPRSGAGGSVDIQAVAISRSVVPVAVKSVSAPFGAVKIFESPKVLSVNQPLQISVKTTIPEYSSLTEPLWHPLRAADDRVAILGERAGLAEEAAPLECLWVLEVGGTTVSLTTPLTYRTVDPVKGEVVQPFRIAPALTLDLDATVYVVPAGARKPGILTVVVQNGDEESGGSLTLELPNGWSAEPVAREFKLAARASEVFHFGVTPGEGARSGSVNAVAKTERGDFRCGLVKINYPHVTGQVLYPPATAKLLVADIQREGAQVGYIDGSGDEVAKALTQLGFTVTHLTDEALANDDLSKFHAIVAGVRAYNTRPKLATLQPRLLQFVEAGGTLVLQYNTTQELTTKLLGPYPFDLSRERVTVEDSPVKFADPNHPLLTRPNKITVADFEGWVQERGLYFPGKWDSNYSAPLEMGDPGEGKKAGGVLYVNYGKGVFIYTSIAFFRQLPEGVLGAYRLFANMVSARAQE